MFTGLIENVGELVGRAPLGGSAKLTVRTDLPVAEIALGDSVAVNGVCLTVEAISADAGTLIFHMLNETLARTSLGDVPVGGALNLERAVRVGDRLGGHMVSGHVDTTSPILEIGRRGDDYAVTIQLPKELRPLVIPKGSISVDGISLTIAELTQTSFTVCLIPHTWSGTNLSSLRAGRRVNLEADMVGKYVLRSQTLKGEGELTLETLARAGF